MKIYLAGPEVFFPNPEKEGKRLKELCIQFNHEGIFPLDGILDLTGMDHSGITKAIFLENISKIDLCDAVIANISPFRGPNMDAGTAFEIGYAYAQKKRVIGWTLDNRDYLERVADFYDGTLLKSDCWRDPNNLEVEDFKQTENLMITSAFEFIASDFETALKQLK